MMLTISAAVGADYTLETASARGYVGESNAEELAIALGPFAQAGFDCYYLHFDTMTCGGRTCSEPITAASDGLAYLDGTTLYCPLTERLTSTGRLRVQVEGQKTENGMRMVKKSSIITLEFLPSIMPAGTLPGWSGYDRLAALEAELAGIRAQITALETENAAQISALGTEINAQMTAELTALSTRLTALETAAAALSAAVDALETNGQPASYTLPAATADTLGGVRVAQTNAVCTDGNGRLTVNEGCFDWKLSSALFVVSLLDFNRDLRVLIDSGANPEATVRTQFSEHNMDVIDGNREAFLFVSVRNISIPYLDENYDEHDRLFVRGTLYVLRMQNDVLVIESLGGESLRQLLLQGV